MAQEPGGGRTQRCEPELFDVGWISGRDPKASTRWSIHGISVITSDSMTTAGGRLMDEVMDAFSKKAGARERLSCKMSGGKCQMFGTYVDGQCLSNREFEGLFSPDLAGKTNASRRLRYPGGVLADAAAAVAAARRMVDAAERVTVLTGAGISTDSGLPDFRGPKGLWTRDPAAERASNINVYVSDPEVRRNNWARRAEGALWGDVDPNRGHEALGPSGGAGQAPSADHPERGRAPPAGRQRSPNWWWRYTARLARCSACRATTATTSRLRWSG